MNASSHGYVIRGHHNTTQAKSPLVCYAPTMISMGGIWRGESPLDFSFPLFLLQLLIIILTTRATALVLHPFHQPRYLAEIIGGLLLGPSVMGNIPNFGVLFFPLRSLLILETMANLGLIYYIFIVGIELDRSAVHRTSQSAAFTAACIGIPFVVCCVGGLLVPPQYGMTQDQATSFLIFLCVNLSITAFSVIARCLAELKLLNTTLGTTALTSAILVDSCAWVMLALAITIFQGGAKLSGTLHTLISGLVLYVVIMTICKGAIEWVIDRTPKGEQVDDFYACLILVAVLAAAFASDALGLHAITGPFILGLVIPSGPLGEALIERVEDIVKGILMPLFYATSGLRIHVQSLASSGAAAFVVMLVVIGTGAKVGGCVVVALMYDMPLRDGFAMGLLMNTKGVIEIVLLNIGRDRQLLNDEAFTTLVCLSVIMGAISGPLLRCVVRPSSSRLSLYTRRTVQWPKHESELRIILCVHSTRHVPTSIALLDSLTPTRHSPISAFALQLIELTSRASAMLIISTATAKEAYASNPLGFDANTSSHFTAPSATSRLPSDNIMHAFDAYGQHTPGASVQPLTAVSPYATMHQDICDVAEENLAALIVLPFHKRQTVDGGMGATNPAIRALNQNVLASAPCSVAILIDRELRMASRLSTGVKHHATLLFLGGPDDREAISVGSRMVEHPGIHLTVVRFMGPPAEEALNVVDEEKQIDDDCIDDFRLRYVSYESVAYEEILVNNAEETMAAIKGTLEGARDLFIVGRGSERETPLTEGLTEWSECPELGAIGDLLASADFGATVSVLVVQQCRVKTERMKAYEKQAALEQDNIDRMYHSVSLDD